MLRKSWRKNLRPNVEERTFTVTSISECVCTSDQALRLDGWPRNGPEERNRSFVLYLKQDEKKIVIGIRHARTLPFFFHFSHFLR